MAATEFKTQAIANSAITTLKIGDAQVTQPKLAPGVGGNTDKSFSLQKADQSIPSPNISTNLTWTIENFDTDNLHDNAVNNDRVTITAATAGKWLFVAIVGFAGNTSGQRSVAILKNGGQLAQVVLPPPGANNMALNVQLIVDVAAGDFIQVSVFQDSGVSLNALGDRSKFMGIRIAT